MSFYREFTSSRTTRPHMQSLFQALRVQDATIGISANGTPPPNTVYKVKKETNFTAQHINFIQNAIDTAPVITNQLVAKFQVDSMSIFERAFFLTLVDQINVLRTQIGLPTVTPAQAFQAIKNKADTL